jgi:hypothetical protein
MANHISPSMTRFGLAALVALTGACSKESSPLPEDVRSVMFLQRAARNDNGNVFDYTSYVPGGRLVMLEPPSADGKLTVLTWDQVFTDADIMSYDLSFDAKSVVFSARLKDAQTYHLFSMNIDGSNVKQLTEGPYDYVYPIHVPGQKILFMTSKCVEPGAKQFRDEYERAVAAQVGTINIDGTAETLGPRNVSHRVSPALMPDGRVAYTEWRHMGNVNDGHLRIMNADMTRMSEGFGGELAAGVAGTETYLKARFVQQTSGPDGRPNYQMVAIGTERDRTLQAGKLMLLNLNGSEAASTSVDMTPLIPERGPSPVSMGRYYDAEIIGDPNAQKFLVSWAGGPVESEVLDVGKTLADFGVYLFDGKSGQKFPIYDDHNYWDILARPVKARTEPAPTESPIMGTSTVVGALNVYDTSDKSLKIEPGTVVKVRLIEGFSGEEGIRTFGTSEFDGQSLYGEVNVQPDNSFAARVPANVPFHMQLLDKFAMNIANETIWISGRAGEQRFCGGCHENRSKTAQIAPGVTENVLRGAVDLDVPRPQRLSMDFSYGKIRGVPWDKAIQPIFDAKCISCHDGDPAKPGNKSYTVTDMTAKTMQTFVFDLRGDKLSVTVGEKMTAAFSKSYLSVMGLGELLGENLVTITGDASAYAEPGSAKSSKIIKKLNPPQRFPDVNTAVRAFAGGVHPTGVELTADEYYRLILSIDMGGQFFSRENRDGADADPYTAGKN